MHKLTTFTLPVIACAPLVFSISACYFQFTVTDDMVLRLQKNLRHGEKCEFKVVVFDTETTLHSIHVSVRCKSYNVFRNMTKSAIVRRGLVATVALGGIKDRRQ